MNLIRFIKKHPSIAIFTFFVSLVIAAHVTSTQAEGDYGRVNSGYIQDTVTNAETSGSISQEPIVVQSALTTAWAIGDAIYASPDSTGKIPEKAFKKSITGQTTAFVSKMYESPPANLALWVNDTGQTLGFIPKSTYAQGVGVGYSGLRAVMDTWKAFRNAAYILVALALVIVGFMIMFRRRIDPHTVVTIQNSLPRIIMVLIFITFSYAIAAFLIDMMYVILFASFALIANSFKLDAAAITNWYIGGGILGLAGQILNPLTKTEGPGGLASIIAGAVGGGLSFSLPGAILGGLGAWVVQGVVGTVASQDGGVSFLNPILWLLIAVTLFFLTFRIFFMLVGSYIQILFAVIIGPLQILIDIFPGMNTTRSWIMGIIGNLLTFVVIGSLITIVGAIVSNIGGGDLWAPPVIGSIDDDMLKMIVAAGGMMMIPNAVKMMKDALKAQSAMSAAGSAISGVGGGVGTLMGAAHTFTSLDHLSGNRISKTLPWNKGHGGHEEPK